MASRNESQPNTHTDRPSVDIIVCVHNALHFVRGCLDAVVQNTPRRGMRVIVVNDGSDEPTSTYVRRFAERYPFITLIENTEAQGYTKAANRGLRASTAAYAILLNSDAVVPPGWIDRILECGESDERIGIIGPLSNAASYQSVPDIRSVEGDWAVNTLPVELDLDEMAAKVLQISERRFPRAPFLNGFCYAIKREVINAVGLFDEETFPVGFGEENDFSIRAREAGFELAVADHAYVYHHKSKSFSKERRQRLAKSARAAIEAKHGREKLTRDVEALEQDPYMQRLRLQLRDFIEERIAQNVMPGVRGVRILYLLRGKGGGGGVHSIYQESTGMRKFGVHTEIALPAKVREHYERFYPNAPDDLFYYYTQEADLWNHAAGFDVVIATIFTTVRPLKELYDRVPSILPAYYIQDYEPWIIRDPTPELVAEAKESYTLIPDMVCFAKTHWICETVQHFHGTKVNKVRPSLDRSVYYPDRIKKSKGGPLRIVAMVRPTTPRRSPERTMEVLREIKRRQGEHVHIIIFGNDPESDEFLAMPRDFEFENRGILIREEVAELMGESDIFADLSTYQAFGRTGLEAMAVGCATVLPRAGGVYEYAVDGENALIVDTSSFDACVEAIEELIVNKEMRRRFKRAGLETARGFSVRSAVISELEVLRDALEARRGK